MISYETLRQLTLEALKILENGWAIAIIGQPVEFFYWQLAKRGRKIRSHEEKRPEKNIFSEEDLTKEGAAPKAFAGPTAVSASADGQASWSKPRDRSPIFLRRDKTRSHGPGSLLGLQLLGFFGGDLE